MPELSNGKHEAFAEAVAGGASAARGYRTVYTSAQPATAETEGPKLRRNPQVSLRIQELKALQAEIAATEFKMDRAAVVRTLVEIIKTPIGDVKEGHPLCQEYSETVTDKGWSYRFKMPSKLDAVEKLIKMSGWYEPEKIEHSGGLDGMFAELTGVTKRKTPSV